MKKVVAWVLAWSLFYLGHYVSYTLRYDWSFTHTAYRLYQWSMCMSADVQDSAGLKGPWEVCRDR